jgi:lipoprotein-anchoring transpeptidase ErfK/SrfK
MAAVPLAFVTACTATGTASDASPVAATVVRQSQAELEVLPRSDATGVRPDQAVSVVSVNGRLSDVVVRPTSGPPLAGRFSPDRTTWTATAGLLPLGTSYVVQAQAVDAAGYGKVVRSTFTTVTPKATLRTVITPGNGSRVGVGMPIRVQFTAPVADRQAVEERLSVTTSVPVEGDWRWTGAKEAIWRPRELWPAGTDVVVRLALAGTDAGAGVWGDRDRVLRFSVADAMVSTVDIAKHTMTVRRNGAVLKVLPITTGKEGFETRNGVKVIMSKERTRVMDSATIDIPAGSPDSYRLEVEYAMRLTYSGEFIHAAPWSVRQQGRANVSHGCTGMSLANAAWLYSVSRPGDVVRYVGGQRSLESWNGYTAWNVPWERWLTDTDA